MRLVGPARRAAIGRMVIAAGFLSFTFPTYAQFGFTSRFDLVSNVQLDEIDSISKTHLERIDALLADQQ